MADFPCLQLVPSGERFALVRVPFVLGSGPGVDLPLSPLRVAPRHCEVVHELDRWWVRDLGSPGGTFHGGERVNDAELRDGDCFELGEGLVFRFLLSEPTDARNEALEKALVERPEDEACWSVYADWLLEQGAPLGQRLRRAEPDDDFRWLGPLAGDAGRGELQVRWAHGLPVHAVLRSLSGTSTERGWERRLSLLLATPSFRFLRGLEVDCGSFRRQRPEPEWGLLALTLLQGHLPSLERLALGPGTPPADLAGLAPLLSTRRAASPRFQTTAQTLFRAWGPATLIEDGQSYPLAPAAGALFPRGGAPVLRLFFEHDRWAVVSLAQAGVRLNGGEARTHAYLRPGDELRLPNGQVLRFEA